MEDGAYLESGPSRIPVQLETEGMKAIHERAGELALEVVGVRAPKLYDLNDVLKACDDNFAGNGELFTGFLIAPTRPIYDVGALAETTAKLLDKLNGSTLLDREYHKNMSYKSVRKLLAPARASAFEKFAGVHTERTASPIVESNLPVQTSFIATRNVAFELRHTILTYPDLETADFAYKAAENTVRINGDYFAATRAGLTAAARRWTK